MKRAILLLLVLALPVSAQEVRPGWSALRRQGSDFLMGFYRLPSVQEACLRYAEVTVPFDGPGHEITVDCAARRTLFRLVVQFYRSPDVSKACAEKPEETVAVHILGTDVPVDCGARDEDLRLIEGWLKQ